MRAREFILEGILSRIGSFFQKCIWQSNRCYTPNAFSKLDFDKQRPLRYPRAIKEANLWKEKSLV